MSVTISYPSTQFEELYESFVNLGAYLPPKDNSPKKIYQILNYSKLNFNFVKIVTFITYNLKVKDHLS